MKARGLGEISEVRSVNFIKSHLDFFGETNVNKSKLIRELIDLYPLYIYWKERRNMDGR